MAGPTWFTTTATGLLLRLRVTPNAGRDGIEGAEIRDDGTEVLRVRVSAVPDRGKANAAVIMLIAAALGVPKSAIAVVSGEASRFKLLAVRGDAEGLAERAQRLGRQSGR